MSRSTPTQHTTARGDYVTAGCFFFPSSDFVFNKGQRSGLLWGRRKGHLGWTDQELSGGQVRGPTCWGRSQEPGASSSGTASGREGGVSGLQALWAAPQGMAPVGTQAKGWDLSSLARTTVISPSPCPGHTGCPPSSSCWAGFLSAKGASEPFHSTPRSLSPQHILKCIFLGLDLAPTRETYSKHKKPTKKQKP